MFEKSKARLTARLGITRTAAGGHLFFDLLDLGWIIAGQADADPFLCLFDLAGKPFAQVLGNRAAAHYDFLLSHGVLLLS
jgi:hypothetical protein